MKKIYHQFKCSAIMLPEHRTMLKNQNEREAAKTNQVSASPDEQQLEEFDRHIKKSLEKKEELELYLKSSQSNSLKLRGVVKESETSYSYIRLLLREGKCIKIPKKDILKIEKKD